MPRSSAQRGKVSLRNGQGFHAKIFLDERAMKRRQIRGESQLGIVMLDGNRRANLISGDMRAQFDAAQRIRLHLDADLGLPRLTDDVCGVHDWRALR
jgi:hypothetical protein